MGLLTSKTITFLVMPFSLFVVLVLVGIVGFVLGLRKLPRVSFTLGIVILLVCSSPLISGYLTQSLESQYPPVAIKKVPKSGVIVVLGGVLAQPQPPRLESELVESSDRILHAFRLYKAGKAPLIFLSAGNIGREPGEPSEAEYISWLLQEWGVSKQDIRIGSGSRTTRENALETWDFLNANGLENERVLLVTSGKHMPRAVKTFENLGMKVFPCTTDVTAGAAPHLTFTSWLPNLGSLRSFTKSWHEYLGTWIYQWRGWI